MIELSRTVRMFLTGEERTGTGSRNGYAGWPPCRGLTPFIQLHIQCRGRIHRQTGYLLNIKLVDEAARCHALPVFHAALASAPCPGDVPLGRLMQDLFRVLQPPLGSALHQLRLEVSPYHHLTLRSDSMHQVTVRQQYEFSAAHRLHVPELSDQENRRLFGKCNNPSGHGHNYQLEVAVRCPIDEHGHTVAIDQLDALINEVVIDKLDHKHLNLDVSEFAQLNPSVENIAVVIYDLIRERIGELKAELEEIRVWETPKTVCTYRGPESHSV